MCQYCRMDWVAHADPKGLKHTEDSVALASSGGPSGPGYGAAHAGERGEQGREERGGELRSRGDGSNAGG
jgi:hypothetical protein